MPNMTVLERDGYTVQVRDRRKVKSAFFTWVTVKDPCGKTDDAFEPCLGTRPSREYAERCIELFKERWNPRGNGYFDW